MLEIEDSILLKHDYLKSVGNNVGYLFNKTSYEEK